MMSDMQRAIEKLKQLAEDNDTFTDKLEAGEIDVFPDCPVKRTEDLIRTYRYWSQCLYIAAWLLGNDQTERETGM